MRTWFGSLWFARSGSFGNYAVLALAAGICLATGALVWFGYVATREWRRGTEMLLERRQAEALALVSAAIDRDMKGAATLSIIPMDHPTIDEDPPYDLRLLTAQLFARYPYPESLIVWKAGKGSATDTTYAFSRAERRPAWDAGEGQDEPFPVSLDKNPLGLRGVADEIRRAQTPGHPFAVVNTSIGSTPYQILVRYLPNPEPPFELSAFAALTVNMNWVRNEYFEPVLQQTATIGGTVDVVSFSVQDGAGNVLAITGSGRRDPHGLQRSFPALFIDPALLASRQSAIESAETWSVHVLPADDDTLGAASRGSQRSLILIAITAAIGIGALMVTIRAVEAKSALAAMKSDFVAAVTHDLKTPVAIIRLVGDTLASGRYSPSALHEYAGVLSRESSRLARAIDQLLTYARYSQAQKSDALHLSRLKLQELVETGIEMLRPSLAAANCELTVDVPASLPAVHVDRQAIMQVMENIIDNALKYSGDNPVLRITGQVAGGFVVLTFADQGQGIAREDIDHVFDRFYRGRNASGAGSGLGLTIAKRILEYHGGDIRLRSNGTSGTDVMLLFPVQNT